MPSRGAAKPKARKGRKTHKGRKAQKVPQGMATSAAIFPRFSDLPIEIRFLVWELILPEARLLKIVAKRKPKSKPKPADADPSELKKSISNDKADPIPEDKYTITPASSGGSNPGIFYVNRESRNFALQHFTKIFGVYFNFDCDVLFFEFKNMLHKEVMIMTEVFREGLLGRFKHIAIDSGLWNWTWEGNAASRRFAAWKEPRIIINELHNIETCAVTYMRHTHQGDIVAPGQPWRLGPLNAEVSNDRYLEFPRTTDSNMAHSDWSPYGKQIKLRKGVELSLKGVHGRKREPVPETRPEYGWTLSRPEYNWLFYPELW